MRLPQSITHLLSVPVSFAMIVAGCLSLTSLSVRAAAQQLTSSPSVLTFGWVEIGASKTKAITFTNSGKTSVKVSAIALNGSEFSTPQLTLPFTLAAGKSVAVNVKFTPTTAKWAEGKSTLTSNASNTTLDFIVMGTGEGSAAPSATGKLTVSPATLSFGDVPIGTTQTQSITLSASGASVIVSSDASSSSQFVLDGISLPLTIAAGKTVSFNVAFTPKSSGTQSGSLSFVSNASDSKTSESLNGTGSVAAYSVSLYWNASSEVTGYNVYRSTSASGTYAKINPSLDANTAYSDGTVVSGQTYYYEATSVNSSGKESARSTPPVEAKVP
ncbi:MAG: choice-of-anchor D domain-containing protein [Candidatus Sulfotelmatobacter sp.]